MRLVFIGAGEFTTMAVRDLIARDHDVVIIESDRERIDELSDEIGCSFVHGDGTRPAILREVAGKADVLVAATDDDRANLLAAIVARHLGFERVVITVEDADLEAVCSELGFENVVVPARSVGRVLRDVALGVPGADPARALRNGAQLYTFAVPEDLVGGGRDALEMPDGSRAIWVNRDSEFVILDAEVRFEAEDEIVVVTHAEAAAALSERYGQKREEEEEGGAHE